jgi:hypothetical protein
VARDGARQSQDLDCAPEYLLKKSPSHQVRHPQMRLVAANGLARPENAPWTWMPGVLNAFLAVPTAQPWSVEGSRSASSFERTSPTRRPSKLRISPISA